MARKKFNMSTYLRNVLTFFVTNLISSLVVFICIFIALSINERIFNSINLTVFVIILLVVTCLISFVISLFVSKRMDRYQSEMQKVIAEVVAGNFDVRMSDAKGTHKFFTDNINKMISELKNVQILRSDFVSNFSHEFKTPIISINGFSEMLLNEKLTKKEQKEYLQIIYDESTRLAKMSNNILLLTSLEQTTIVPDKTEFFLDQQLNSAIKLLSKDISAKKLNIDITTEKIKLFANKDMLNEVWINLLNNAIKYSNENATIYITAKYDEDIATVSIKDTGIGMTEDAQKHIFDRFYQADKSHSAKGNGLGLAIAKQIVTLHEGEISVESYPEKGTTFTVKIPTK